MENNTMNLKQLYEEDYLLWLEQNIKLLSDRQLQEIDYDHLIEELESLGRSEKRTVESLMKQLLIHLLLYQYWTTEHQKNANHWTVEILSFRDQLNEELDSKTIYNYAREKLDKIYQSAVKLATKKSTLILPNQCPYSFEQILDENWLPQPKITTY
ncbi:DUF29 domain-containing protein [Cronbergia sp. UHCC 0137]|uniref:DUF29 domain-containing protein n=1 Tax=Cronbergia sp. UHCC 0137 TaxID=3110239 RepID=UPI002B21E3DC|nr:DUF29 domain-containing protein [Cronbergia sp. UHCC 0137]MEA5618978.1 DUF29 domain-containing protein [Cronbergia sp. UHCC 0137]